MANKTFSADYVKSVVDKKREQEQKKINNGHVFTAEYVNSVITGERQAQRLANQNNTTSQTSQDLRPGLNDGALKRTPNENKANAKNEPVWGNLGAFAKMASNTLLGDEQDNNFIDYIMNPALLDGGNSKKPAFEMTPTENQVVEYTPEGMPYFVEKKQNKNAEAFAKNFAYNLPGFKWLVGATDKYVDPLLGTNLADAQGMREEVQKLQEENKVASTAGALGGNLAGYYVGGQLVNSAPALANMTGQSAQTVANALTGGKLSAPAVQAGAKPLQNILADTSVDVALDVLPNLAEMAKDGATGGEIAKQALGKTAENLAFNAAGETVSEAIDSLKGLDTTGKKTNLSRKVSKLDAKAVKNIDPADVALSRGDLYLTHTPEEISDMQNYVNSTDNEILDYIKRARSGEKIAPLKLKNVDSKMAKEMERITGIKAEGNDVLLKQNAIKQHIDTRHGITGTADQSMADDNSLARIQYVLDNYDESFKGKGTSATRLADGSNAPTAVFTKKIDGHYYVVEAVTDAKSKENVIVSAYIGNADSIEENIKKGNITRVNHVADNQPLHRTPKTEPALFASNNILPTTTENVNAPGDNFLDEIAESTQKEKNIPKTRIAKDSKLSKMDKDISNLVKWYGDETAVADLEELRTAIIDFENTGSTDALNRIGELTAKLDDNFQGKTYTYNDRYNKNGSLKSKGVTYKYGDNTSVEAILEEALPAIDEIHASKALNISTPQIVQRIEPEIPYLREAPATGGRVLEESHSMNIGKGRVNNVDEDVQNAFIDDPNLYTQLSNAETVEKAQRIYDSGNAENEIYRMLDQKDPAAIPLGNKIVGDLIDEGRKDEAVELLRTMSTKLRESGQFSQAAAITMIKSDPETALRYVVRNIDDMNAAGKKKFGNKWKDFELTDAEAELFGNIKPGDTEAIKNAFESVGARLSKEYPVTTWEKLVELSRMGMLLNPRTNIRNVISNWMLQPVRSLTDRVSALGQNAIHIINPDFKVTQSITGGGKQEKQLATEVWNSVKDSLLENTSRYEDVKGAVKDKQIFKGSVASKAFDRLFPGAIERANKAMGKNVDDSLLETARNFTYFLLEKGDEPFVKNNFVNRLASYMKAQGIKNIDEIPEDAIMLAKEEALKATFKDDNKFTNTLSNIKKNLGKGGEVLMPFTKTPANLAMRGIDYSPAGLINTFKKAKNGADVGKIMDDLSKNITGSAAIFLGYKLAENGIITGALSSDKDEAAFQKQQGQLAYSIKVGDNYYSYDWAQPSAIPFILGASIAQSVEESDNEEKTALEKIESMANIAQQATTSAADAWVELSPLQTISDIFDTSYGNSVPENVINEVLEFPQRFIPSSVGALARTVDTTQRQTYSAENPVRTQIDTAISKIPFLSKTLPAAYDTWGREIKRSDSTGEAAFAQMLNPGTLGNNVSTPIDGEIQRLYEATENKAVFPQKSAWTVDGQKLSNKEYSDLQKEQGSLSYEMVETLIENPSYSNMDDSLKSKTIAELYSLTKALAENSVMDKPISSTNEKLAKIYNKNGSDGVVQYLAMKSTADVDSSGSISQDEAKRALDKTNLSREQKAYYWQLFNAGWKKNPYK